jgi:transcriptional regulator with XRE-family HTH domain
VKSSELDRFMKKNNFSQKFLALVVGRTPRQIRHWLHGQNEIPQAVALLLMAYDENQLEAKWLAKAIKKLNPQAAKGL